MSLVKGAPRQNSHCFLDIHLLHLPMIRVGKDALFEIVVDVMDTRDSQRVPMLCRQHRVDRTSVQGLVSSRKHFCNIKVYYRRCADRKVYQNSRYGPCLHLNDDVAKKRQKSRNIIFKGFKKD